MSCQTKEQARELAFGTVEHRTTDRPGRRCLEHRAERAKQPKGAVRRKRKRLPASYSPVRLGNGRGARRGERSVGAPGRPSGAKRMRAESAKPEVRGERLRRRGDGDHGEANPCRRRERMGSDGRSLNRAAAADGSSPFGSRRSGQCPYRLDTTAAGALLPHPDARGRGLERTLRRRLGRGDAGRDARGGHGKGEHCQDQREHQVRPVLPARPHRVGTLRKTNRSGESRHN